MSRVIFDGISMKKSDSFRSISLSNLTKSVYIPKNTRNFKVKQPTASTLNRPAIDYLSLLSPKTDFQSPIDQIESKESIIDNHLIKELISGQESKRSVRSIKEFLNLKPSYSLLNKLSNEFRQIEAKVKKI
jgi:hypothetical protein